MLPMRATSKGPTRQEVSAGGVVFRGSGSGVEYALIKAGGRWSFPKGNIEKGETPELAALREISEETGLPLGSLSIVGRLPDVEYAFRWGGALVFKKVHNYLVHLKAEAPLEPQLGEIEEVRWFSPDEARRAISFKNAKQTLDAAVAGVEAWQFA